MFLQSKTNFGHLGGRMRSENRTVFGTTLRSIPRRFGRTFRRKRQKNRRKFRRTPLKFRRTPLKFRRTPWGSQAPPLHEPVFSPKALKNIQNIYTNSRSTTPAAASLSKIENNVSTTKLSPNTKDYRPNPGRTWLPNRSIQDPRLEARKNAKNTRATMGLRKIARVRPQLVRANKGPDGNSWRPKKTVTKTVNKT